MSHKKDEKHTSHLGDVLLMHFVCSRRYKVGQDPGRWLKVDPETGDVTTVKSPDRESPFVVDGVYTSILIAVDSGEFFHPFANGSNCFIHFPPTIQILISNTLICQMSLYL